MGESTKSSCADASGSLATLSEVVVTTMTGSSTLNPNSVTTESIERIIGTVINTSHIKLTLIS